MTQFFRSFLFVLSAFGTACALAGLAELATLFGQTGFVVFFLGLFAALVAFCTYLRTS